MTIIPRIKQIFCMLALHVIGITILSVSTVYAAGTLTPVESDLQAIQITDHTVKVSIINGFAKTMVQQTFYNPNPHDLEAIYSFPLPKSASLSEVTITIGEKVINGEVIGKTKAEKIYEDEKNRGRESGLASKNKYQEFRFRVSPVRAGKKAVIRFVYYQPLEVDTGIGRYVYPLEDGETDDAALGFWTTNSKVEGMFSIEVDVKSASPLTNVRAPGYALSPVEDRLAEGVFKGKYEKIQSKLDKDFVFYYKLQDNLPGRIEVVPYRSSKNKPGTFMMVVTPGLDLRPLTNGSDYIFVLDKSGSMHRKIKTLAKGVIKALGSMRDQDRFRIITFDTRARELTSGWVNATQGNVEDWANRVQNIDADQGTNLYEAIEECFTKIRNDDRATSIVLVTDGVTNTGIVDPELFYKLIKQYDIRVFGFLMGNNSNWPLMRMICKTTGGFYSPVSNSDDIIGQLLKAKSKVTHECLHDVTWKISGVKVFDVTDQNIGKIYRGQQLVLFGRYKTGGKAKVAVKARLTGQDKTYSTDFTFPEIDTDNPEIERLWAMNQVEMTEDLMNTGRLNTEKGKARIKQLGIDYQIVTDETSMLVVSDETFKKHGIKRTNLKRISRENLAQSRRQSRQVRNYRVDKKKRAFRYSAPSFRGGGALNPFMFIVIGMFCISLTFGMKKKKKW